MKSKSLFRLIVIIFLLVLLVVFVTQNLSTVDVYFFVYLGKPAVISVILVSLLIGYVLGLLTYTLIFRGGKNAEVKKGKESMETTGERTKSKK